MEHSLLSQRQDPAPPLPAGTPHADGWTTLVLAEASSWDLGGGVASGVATVGWGVGACEASAGAVGGGAHTAAGSVVSGSDECKLERKKIESQNALIKKVFLASLIRI